MPYAALANLHWNGPASAAMVVEDGRGEVHTATVKGTATIATDQQGTGEVHYMRPIRLRGFPMDSQGLGEFHAFQPRMSARMALDVAISQLSQDDVVGALQTMPVSEEMTFQEFCTAMIAYMEQGGSAPTPEQNASAILAAAQVTPIHSDIKKVNNVTVTGTGVEGDTWGPA